MTYHIDFGDGNTSDENQSDEPGEFWIWHRYAEKGYYTVTITVDDGDGGTDSRTFIVSVDEDWGAKVSGGINDTISGGSAMMYYYNDKRNICHKLITLYDDANNSIISFNEESNKGITNRTIPLTFNSQNGMNVGFQYKINSELYGTTKIMGTLWDQTTDINLLSNTLSADSMAKVAPIPSDDFANGDFVALGGQLVTGPLTGNGFKGEYTITLKERPKNSADVPRLIGISGTFEINANPRSYEQMQNGCEGVPDDFVVTDYSPLNHEGNVHPAFPCLEVEFSEPIDINSADFNTIQLGYYDNMSRFVSVPLGFEAVSETRIKFIPAAPLRNAIIYQAIIKSGDRGIRSREGGSLSEDFRWEFETLVKPTDVSVRVYQTIKEKPLIKGKQTLVRIIFNWEKPDDVHPNSFVKRFEGYMSLKNSAGTRLNTNASMYTFRQQDYVTSEEILWAANSANVTEWKPDPGDGDKLIIEIEPWYSDCVPNDERRKFKITHPIQHNEKALELTCDYYFLPIHTWANGGLSDDQILMADQIMDKVSAFSVQLFPIRKLNTNNMGIFPAYGSDFVNYGDPGTDSISVAARNNALLEGIMRDFYLTEAVYSQADIVLVFLPQIDGVCRGYTYTHTLNSFFPGGDRYFRMELTPLFAEESGNRT